MSDSKQKLLNYFEYLLKYANNVKIIADSNFYIIDANNLALKIFDYPKNELIQMSFYDLITSDSKIDFDNKIKILNQKESLSFITKSLKKDGQVFISEINSSVIRHEDDVFYKITVRDISKLSVFDNKLFEESLQLRAIIDASPASIWFKDTKNNFIRVNKAAAAIAKKDICDIEGKSADLIIPVESDNYFADDLEVINSGLPKIGIIESVTSGDEVRWVRTDKIPWINSKGEIAGVIAFSLDITEQKQSEELHSKENNLLNSLLENIPDIIYAKDLDSKFIICNLALAKRWGFTSLRELVGKSDFDIFPYDLALKFRREEQEIINTGKAIYNQEESMTTSSGKTIWGLTTKIPFRDNQGNIIGIVGLNRDITILKESQENVNRAHNLLRTLIDNLPDAVYVKDIKCRKTLANKADIYNMGYTREEEVIGKTDFDCFSKEVATLFFEDDQSVLKKGQPVIDKEEFFIDKNNNRRWLLTSKLPLFDENKNTIGLLGIGHDITDRKVAEEALKASEQKYKSVFNTAPLGIAHININLELTDYNSMLLDILDIPEKDSLGFDFKKIDDLKFQNALEIAFAGSISFYEGDYQSTGSQKVISLKATFSPIFYKNEKILSVVGIFEDISERKQIERFFFHDILNSAGNLRSYAQMLIENLIESSVNKSLVTDALQIKNLSNRVIEEIVSHRLILTSDKREIKLKLSDISSSDFISELIRNSINKADDENKKLVVAANFEDLTIQTDRTLLSRVIENLIKNALEASFSGGTVTVGCQNENNMVSFWVHNQTSIPIEVKSKIFNRSFSTKGPGRGIGTYSIKFLTEKYLKGTVSFISTEDDGTTFKIILPVQLPLEDNPASMENSNKDDDQTIENENIEKNEAINNKLPELLLVDDDEIAIKITNAFSRKLFKIDYVSNGLAAIEAVKLKNYSVILMDISLGQGMSGLDTIKVIRTLPRYEDTPIIAFTAYAMRESKQTFLAGGCTHFLAKPFTRDQLINTINEAISSNFKDKN